MNHFIQILSNLYILISKYHKIYQIYLVYNYSTYHQSFFFQIYIKSIL